MRFKVDENLPREVVQRLQQADHDAVAVLDQQLEGASDKNLAHVCQLEAVRLLRSIWILPIFVPTLPKITLV
jgi:predicted nuclease of predicted toxin-antitoxin system